MKTFEWDVKLSGQTGEARGAEANLEGHIRTSDGTATWLLRGYLCVTELNKR